MPTREIFGKSAAFLLVGASLIAGGALTLYGTKAYNDYFVLLLAGLLVLSGLGVWAFGTVTVLGIVAQERRRAAEHQVQVTPRPGPLGPPPAWGMGDIGRPGAGITEVGGGTSAPRGGPRLMSVRVSNLDAPVVIAILLIWTVAFLIWLAPR
jgi:hypothetical protein